ncbi:MAG: NEW3 domain-containing protein, partial [Actinomycetota bacterium]|nr:NEW3 domain-containing protein [Actinomycetota bacterium]
LRVLDTAFVDDAQNPRLQRAAFFDTYPANDDPIFEGTWSNYPFFESGTIAVSGINEGLFLVRLSPAVKVKCKDCPIRMRAGQKRAMRLTVGNIGLAEDVYTFDVQRGPKRWKARFRPTELDLTAGDKRRARLRVAVPGTTDPGSYRLVVTATSTVDSAFSRSARIPVKVRA